MPPSQLITKASELGNEAVARSLQTKIPSVNAIMAGAFWVGYFLIVWLAVDPSLRIHNSSFHFYSHPELLEESIMRPGGLLEYGASWLALSDWIPFCGAFLATALALVISLLTRGLAGRLHTASASYLAILASFLLLLQQSNYETRPGATALGLILILIGNWSLASAFRMPSIAQVLLFSVLIIAIQYLTGIGAALFALWTVALAVKEKKWLSSGILIAAAILMSWFGIQFLYPTAPHGTWMKLFWSEPHSWLLGGWLIIPLCSLCLMALPGLDRFFKKSFCKRPGLRVSLRAIGLGLILLIPLALINQDYRAWLSMDQAAQHEHWDKVLAQVHRLPVRKNSLPAVVAWIQANRALYHKNRLLDDLFRVPQTSRFQLMPIPKMGFGIGAAMSDLLLDMGQVNYAEHWAHEALELLGDRPHLLLRLAEINQLHERTNAARVFLRCLAGNPAWRSAAQKRLTSLREDPLGRQDLKLSAIRSLMPQSDLAASYLDTETLLGQLLQANPQNRMAFEYLMAHYLLSMQPKMIQKHLKHFQNQHYSRLPRLIEEALLFQQTMEGQSAWDMAGYSISPETQRDYNDFVTIVKRYTQGDASARKELGHRFAATYWFYGVFSDSSTDASTGSQLPAMQ